MVSTITSFRGALYGENRHPQYGHLTFQRFRKTNLVARPKLGLLLLPTPPRRKPGKPPLGQLGPEVDSQQRSGPSVPGSLPSPRARALGGLGPGGCSGSAGAPSRAPAACCSEILGARSLARSFSRSIFYFFRARRKPKKDAERGEGIGILGPPTRRPFTVSFLA